MERYSWSAYAKSLCCVLNVTKHTKLPALQSYRHQGFKSQLEVCHSSVHGIMLQTFQCCIMSEVCIGAPGK